MRKDNFAGYGAIKIIVCYTVLHVIIKFEY
jgi:hypothetical protein